MNTRTLAAYGLAAAMIGGSLVGATALLSDAGTDRPTEVQIVQPDPGVDSLTVVTAPTADAVEASSPSTGQAATPTADPEPGDPVTGQPYGSNGAEAGYDDHDDDDDDDDENEREDHESEDEHGR